MASSHDLIKITHFTPYAAISPLRPELSQSGKTVLITGAATGIGLAIAESFAQANAAAIVIVGRRESVLNAAVSKVQGLCNGPEANVTGYQCDVSSTSSVDGIWDHLSKIGVSVDVLVLNAGTLGQAGPLLETDGVWDAFKTNVQGSLKMAQRFWKQRGRDTKKLLNLINVSTMVIHYFDILGHLPTYSLTKNAGTLLMQLIAKDVSADKMQVINFHPGKVVTATSQEAGIPTELSTEDVKLPGQFAVWAASPEAAFLHGRYVWASWDVNDMMTGELRRKIDDDPNYLKIGVHGY